MFHRVVQREARQRLSVSFHLYAPQDAMLDPGQLPLSVVGATPPRPMRVSAVSLRKKRINFKETQKKVGVAPLITWVNTAPAVHLLHQAKQAAGQPLPT